MATIEEFKKDIKISKLGDEYKVMHKPTRITVLSKDKNKGMRMLAAQLRDLKSNEVWKKRGA